MSSESSGIEWAAASVWGGKRRAESPQAQHHHLPADEAAGRGASDLFLVIEGVGDDSCLLFGETLVQALLAEPEAPPASALSRALRAACVRLETHASPRPVSLSRWAPVRYSSKSTAWCSRNCCRRRSTSSSKGRGRCGCGRTRRSRHRWARPFGAVKPGAGTWRSSTRGYPSSGRDVAYQHVGACRPAAAEPRAARSGSGQRRASCNLVV